MGQIEQDTVTHMVKNGKMKQLSALEKGRAMIKFMNMKNKPAKNRHFYNHFYQEQDKAENIEVLQKLSRNIANILAPKDEI